MNISLTSEIDSETKLTTFRRRVLRLARAAGLQERRATALATVSSEFGRDAMIRSGRVELRVEASSLRIESATPNAPAILERIGRLVDHAEVVEGSLVASLEFDRPLGDAERRRLGVQLLAADPEETAEALLRQNEELLALMDQRLALTRRIEESEQRWRMAAETLGMGAWELLDDTMMLSGTAARLLGIDGPQIPLEELSRWFEPHAPVSEALERLRMSADGSPNVSLEVTASRTRRALAIQARRIPNEDRIVGALLDISAHREREATATALARFRAELVGVVSHDLKSPLSALTMGLALLERAPLEEADRDAVAQMRHAVDRMRGLVVDLLDHTRHTLGAELPIQLQAVEVVDFVRQVVEQVALGHDIDIELSGATSVRAHVDVARIQQAVSNLLENAVEHGQGRVRVNVVDRSIDAPETIAIEVSNGGAVISPDRVARLFEPLQTSSEGRANLGLGLYIVRQIAVAHGGEVTVHSTPETGTTFRLALPAGLE